MGFLVQLLIGIALNIIAYLIAPAIDPLGEQNCTLAEEEVGRTLAQFGLDRSLLAAFSEVPWFAWCLRVWHRRRGESEFAGGARRGMARADS